MTNNINNMLNKHDLNPVKYTIKKQVKYTPARHAKVISTCFKRYELKNFLNIYNSFIAKTTHCYYIYLFEILYLISNPIYMYL